jgi:hypothetical protein
MVLSLSIVSDDGAAGLEIDELFSADGGGAEVQSRSARRDRINIVTTDRIYPQAKIEINSILVKIA